MSGQQLRIIDKITYITITNFVNTRTYTLTACEQSLTSPFPLNNKKNKHKCNKKRLVLTAQAGQ